MQNQFNTYAERLLNRTILKVANKRYRICEIEMYLHNNDHPDKYTHRDPMQLEFNKFYPHKYKTGTYKAGTYKCMDIAYGDRATQTYFGILIRSIRDLDNNKFYCGPCLCVREILSNFNCSEWNEFFNNHTTNEFELIEQDIEHKNILYK